MPNYIPYLTLIFIAAAILITAIVRTKRFRTFVLFLSFAGMIYIFEYFIVVILDAYEYFPHILSNRYHDSMLGAVTSNLMVPSVAILFGVFQLRAHWMVMFALLFGCIEQIFLHLGVYKHYWWKTTYTVVALLFFFWFVRLFARKINEGQRVFRYIAYLMYTFALADSLVFILILLGYRLFHAGLFSNIYRDDIFVTVIFAFAKALVMVNALYWTKQVRWSLLLLAMSVILALNYALIRLDILQIYISYWIYYVVYLFCCFVVVGLSIAGLHSLRNAENPGT